MKRTLTLAERLLERLPLGIQEGQGRVQVDDNQDVNRPKGADNFRDLPVPRPEGRLMDRDTAEILPYNRLYDEHYVDTVMKTYDWWQHNDDYLFVQALAGCNLEDTTEYLEMTSLQHRQHITSQLIEAYQKERAANRLTIGKRVKLLDTLRDEQEQTRTTRLQLHHMFDNMEAVVKRWYFLASVTGYPMVSALARQRPELTVLQTFQEKLKPAPYWLLVRYIRWQYQQMSSGARGLFESDMRFWTFSPEHYRYSIFLQDFLTTINDMFTLAPKNHAVANHVYAVLRDFIFSGILKLQDPYTGKFPDAASPLVPGSESEAKPLLPIELGKEEQRAQRERAFSLNVGQLQWIVAPEHASYNSLPYQISLVTGRILNNTKVASIYNDNASTVSEVQNAPKEDEHRLTEKRSFYDYKQDPLEKDGPTFNAFARGRHYLKNLRHACSHDEDHPRARDANARLGNDKSPSYANALAWAHAMETLCILHFGTMDLEGLTYWQELLYILFEDPFQPVGNPNYNFVLDMITKPPKDPLFPPNLGITLPRSGAALNIAVLRHVLFGMTAPPHRTREWERGLATVQFTQAGDELTVSYAIGSIPSSDLILKIKVDAASNDLANEINALDNHYNANEDNDMIVSVIRESFVSLLLWHVLFLNQGPLVNAIVAQIKAGPTDLDPFRDIGRKNSRDDVFLFDAMESAMEHLNTAKDMVPYFLRELIRSSLLSPYSVNKIVPAAFQYTGSSYLGGEDVTRIPDATDFRREDSTNETVFTTTWEKLYVNLFLNGTELAPNAGVVSKRYYSTPVESEMKLSLTPASVFDLHSLLSVFWFRIYEKIKYWPITSRPSLGIPNDIRLAFDNPAKYGKIGPLTDVYFSNLTAWLRQHWNAELMPFHMTQQHLLPNRQVTEDVPPITLLQEMMIFVVAFFPRMELMLRERERALAQSAVSASDYLRTLVGSNPSDILREFQEAAAAEVSYPDPRWDLQSLLTGRLILSPKVVVALQEAMTRIRELAQEGKQLARVSWSGYPRRRFHDYSKLLKPPMDILTCNTAPVRDKNNIPTRDYIDKSKTEGHIISSLRVCFAKVVASFITATRLGQHVQYVTERQADQAPLHVHDVFIPLTHFSFEELGNRAWAVRHKL